MEAIPETEDVLRRLHQTEPESAALTGLELLTRLVQRVVPDCVGMSVALVHSGITLTFVTPGQPAADLDVLDFLSGGAGRMESSLSLPVLGEDDAEGIIGTVSLYATRPHAFEGCEDRLARLCGAWAPGAVADVDLSFSSRLRAAAGPAILDDQERLDQATGIAAEALGMSLPEARRRLRFASARAGMTEHDLSRLLVEQYQS